MAIFREFCVNLPYSIWNCHCLILIYKSTKVHDFWSFFPVLNVTSINCVSSWLKAEPVQACLVSSLVIYQILIILHRSSKRPKSTKSVQLRQIGLQIRRNEKFHGFFTRISWFEKMASSCKSKRCVSKIVPDCLIILQF